MAERTVIFSDTHFTPAVEPERFKYLARITSNVDRLFILGDLWDSHLCTFSEFMESDWRNLFPIWEDRQAVYLHGNHDPMRLCDERVNLFSAHQTESWKEEIDGLKLHLEHGHRVLRTHNPLLDWIARVRFGESPAGYYFLRWVAPKALKILGPWAAKFRDWGGSQKLVREAQADPDRILVCGHTHSAVLDLKRHYANCGFIDFGFSQYLLIENGEIRLINERY